MTLNQTQKDLIIGSLLGDGNMQTYSNGKTWRYRALHKSEHVDYILYKYSILKDLCGSEPKEHITFDIRTNKSYSRYWFNTLTNPSLRFFAMMFYKYDNKTKKWVKIIPKKIELFLTPLALAFFYMDDGALKWKNHSIATRLCTDNFAYDDVKRLQKVLLKKYKIASTLTKVTNGYRIEILSKESAILFYNIIKPHIHHSMNYKIPI
jgi:hypothetical protein